MPDILHELSIKASPDTLLDAITTTDGLAAFWTDQTDATPKPGTVANFGFGPNRETVFEMRVDIITPDRVEWTCVGGPEEWVGTTLRWSLHPDGDATTLRFEHRDWKREDGAVASCSYTWAMILDRLDHYVVDGRVSPYFAKDGGGY
jgi:uncharacterized protein YndB with AHSA1/START domain